MSSCKFCGRGEEIFLGNSAEAICVCVAGVYE